MKLSQINYNNKSIVIIFKKLLNQSLLKKSKTYKFQKNQMMKIKILIYYQTKFN